MQAHIISQTDRQVNILAR